MKKIFGLDIGPNSIGGAIINIPDNIEEYGDHGNIEWIGSRIIPMEGFVSTKTGKPFKENPLDSFSRGVGISKAAERRIKRGSRRRKFRYKLRRTRLIKTFKILGWLDEGFPENFKLQASEDENFKFQISDFLPFENSTVHEAKKLLGVRNKKGELALPEDWIVYYLRKKALTEKISFGELARITYMMNQRRGFKSGRKDLKEDDIVEEKKAMELTIDDVRQKSDEKNKDGKYTFIISTTDDGIEPWEETRYKKPDWVGQKNKYVVTWKNGKQLKPQIAKEDNWELVVVALDNEMEKQQKYPGEFFFNELVKNRNYKIRQFPVLRKRYQQELEAIWKKQIELNPELREINSDKWTLQKIAETLYPTQTKLGNPKLKEILSNTLLHFISNDIIYYQRDLKSQKGSKSECRYEKKKGIDGEYYGFKCAPKSSPLFQEFRIWQDIHNIKVLQRNGKEEKTLKNGKTKIFDKVDIDVTSDYIDETSEEKLFYLFDNSKTISQNKIFEVLNQYSDKPALNEKTHRINMFFNKDKKLLGNETKEYFRKIFRETDYEEQGEKILNDKEKLFRLWNIAYSISLNDKKKSEDAIFKALTENNNKRGKKKKIIFEFPEKVAWAIAGASEMEASKKYAAYSSKAIKKLLPLMRSGKYWDENEISGSIKTKAKDISRRLDEIGHNPKKIKSISDDEIPQQILKSFIKKNLLIGGLNTYQACYMIYEKHSEKLDYQKYTEPSQFKVIELLPNNSLRNPIVEEVVRECMSLVKDLWKEYGQPNEIHIEMSRDLKKNAKEREEATAYATKNFEERQHIKKILYELLNDGFEQYIDGRKEPEKTKFEIKPNPESPIDISKFRLWKEMSGLSEADFDKHIEDEEKRKGEKIPKNQQIKKYALWLSQKCVSPYTGKIIPLSKLFDPLQYEIEHILPQGLIKYDSPANLVISEWGVNKAKDRELAALFIANKNGSCEYGNTKYELLNYEDYVSHCKSTFRGKKLQNLLATEIPEDFISRQINDTRYIARKLSELLYPVAKGKKGAETDAEKGGIVLTIGSITGELKHKWGLQKVWKKMMKPRFERLERLNGEQYIFENKKDRNDYDFNVKENEKLNVKRIDHRHHALDALVVAATTIEHIRYLNSLNAVNTKEELKKIKRALVKGKIRDFELPWPTFTKEAKEKLKQTIVTFKTDNQVVTKPLNSYFKWTSKNGKWEKTVTKQDANKNWFAVRKSLFKEPQGIVHIKEIHTKSFRTPKEIMKIVELQMGRAKAQNTPLQKTTSYIYDQDTRELVKQIIERHNGDKKQIEQYLKKYKPKDLNGKPIYTVRIAEFNPFAAKRVRLDKSFNHKKIDKIPYGKKTKVSEDKKMTIPQILHEHLSDYENFIKAKKEAEKKDKNGVVLTEEEKNLLEISMPEPFSEEGLEALDKKVGMKIRKVTIKENIGLKKRLNGKLMESDGNAYYIFYEDITSKKRSGFASVSNYDVVKRKQENKPIVNPKNGHQTILLQTNDLVYVPTDEEQQKIIQGIPETEAVDWNNYERLFERLYRVNDFSKTDIYFKPHTFSRAIKSKELHTSFDDKCTRSIDFFEVGSEPTALIKESCIKIKTDRLGNIIKIMDTLLKKK